MSEEVIAESASADVQTVETSATSTDTTAGQVEQAVEKTTEQPEAKSERTFSQKELDEIVQKRLAKEQRRIERFAAAEAELRLLKEQMQRQQQPSETAPQGKPVPQQFADYESYVEALADWKAEQRLTQFREETLAQQRQREAAEKAAQVKTKLSTAASKYADFEEVALSPEVPITQHMAEAIAESDIGGDVAYYLGSNLAEAQRIASLSPAAQIRELVKLEAKLSAPAPVVTTKAPPPITPVGQKATVAKDPGRMSDAEYAKWRKSWKK